MRIRKNGKVIRLTESDLMRITRKVVREQEEKKPKMFSLLGLGMPGKELENVLSKLVEMFKPEEDKFGTYIKLNPADFSKTMIDTKFDLGSKEGKKAVKIRKSLIDAKLIAEDPSDDKGKMMFGTKGKGFKIYFKPAKRMNMNETRYRR